MLQCRFNPVTTALEIGTWTPGPWTLPVEPAATRIEGSGWSFQFPHDRHRLATLGFRQVDVILMFQIDPRTVRHPFEQVSLRWEDDPAVAYETFRGAFHDRWSIEGVPFDHWAPLWLSGQIERRVSGLLWPRLQDPGGLILAERIDRPQASDAGPALFYRTFGVGRHLTRQGYGLDLYRESLQRAAAAGYVDARWICFQSNGAILGLMKRLEAVEVDRCPFYQATLPLPVGSSGTID